MRNFLLAGLPADEYVRVRPYLERVRLRMGEILAECGRVPDTVYFPESGVISVLGTLPDRSSLELAVIGREGAAGVAGLTGRAESPWRLLVQADGEACVLSSEDFQQQALVNPQFLRALVNYSGAVMQMMGQAALCNRFHALQPRVASWLLNMHDRVDGDRLRVTHEIVAQMLGVHRPSATVALTQLHATPAIESGGRGQVIVTDRAALEAEACDCYAQVKWIAQQYAGAMRNATA